MLVEMVARADGVSEDRRGALNGRGSAPDWSAIQDRAVADTEEQVRHLAALIADDAAAQLRSYGAVLSDDHLRGIREPSEFIAKMAYGVAPPVIALSSMSTGMGKSGIAAATAKVLTATGELAEMGMLYLASTKRDLENMIERMGFPLGPDARFAVYTGNKNVELNALGLGYERRNEAPVLFTTQAKFLHLSRFRKNFATNPNFHYRGRERQVRIWDESILPIDTMTISAEQIEAVAAELFRRGQDEAAKQTREFAKGLGEKPHDSVIQVPLLPIELGDHEDDDSEFVKASATLLALADCTVRVYRDEHSGAVMISFREVLPRFLAPLLVLDANADKRAVYQQWDLKRGGLHHLYSPTKTYSNLSIHFADLRAGKEAHRNSGYRKALVDTAVAAFVAATEHGAKRVLFLYNKPEKPSQDMRKLILKEIKRQGYEKERACFLTWGMHKSTNEFAGIKHVVAVGVQQAPLYEITAMARGVARVPANKAIAKENVDAVRETEVLHTLFQGVGRSAVRQTVNGDVPEGCHLWLIASPRGHMRFPHEHLPEWFPGSRVVDWEPFPCKLRGGRLKTDNRPRFVEALLAKKEEPCIKVTDFEGEGFHRLMAQGYLAEEAVKGCIKSRGYELSRNRERPGGPYCYSLAAAAVQGPQ